MILAAAVCPHPPLLVPQLAPGTDAELAGLRAACDAAVRTLLDAGPDRVVVIGAPDPGDHGTPVAATDESTGGTLAAYGVDVRAGGPHLTLPLSLTIGAWLLDRAGWTGPRTYTTGRPDVTERTGLLVMADGTSTRSVKAPGFLDDRAAPYDASIAKALAAGDPQALTALDERLGAELGATGVPALRTLGDIFAEALATTKGARIAAHVRDDEAPFGVGYLVADWVVS